MVGVGHRGDAVAQRELAPEFFSRRIVLDAEQLAEVEPRLVDVVLVVLDEAGALAHQAFRQSVHEFRVTFVVGDGEEPRALVVPRQGLLVVRGSRAADRGGDGRERGLRQQALVVAPGAETRLVVRGDMVAGLAVVLPPGPGGDVQADQHGVGVEVHGASLWVTGVSRRERRGHLRACAWRRRGSGPAPRTRAKGPHPAGSG